MDIVQMHSAVRKLTQQMGMQHVRVIFPEDIDELLNMAISEIINNELAIKANESASRNLPSNIKIGQINALNTLYEVFTFDINGTAKPLTDVNLATGHLMLNPDFVLPSARMYYAATINYRKDSTSDSTDWFPIRIIEDAYLGNTNADYLIRPNFKSPVMTIKHGTKNITFELYMGELNKDRTISNNGYELNKLRLSYIKNPARVAIGCQDGKDRVDCDLPEYMHERIVSAAAQLWINSVMFNKSTMREEAVKAAE